MAYRLAADAVLLAHLAFIVFALFGAALVAWRRGWIWLHLPAAAWAFYVEASASLCPLTHLENHFRRLAGESGYSNSFVEHHVLALIYPSGLTPTVQLALAGVVLSVNGLAYALLIRRWRRRATRATKPGAAAGA